VLLAPVEAAMLVVISLHQEMVIGFVNPMKLLLYMLEMMRSTSQPSCPLALLNTNFMASLHGKENFCIGQKSEILLSCSSH